MAAIKRAISSRLILVVETGTDDEGNPVRKNLSFSRIDPNASDDALFQAADILADLQSHVLFATRRVDDNELIEA